MPRRRSPASIRRAHGKGGEDLIERDLFIKKREHSRIHPTLETRWLFQHGDIFRWECVINTNGRKETIKLTQFKTEQAPVFD